MFSLVFSVNLVVQILPSFALRFYASISAD